MTTDELRQKSLQDLQALATDLRRELFQMRMQLYTGQLHKTHLIRIKRREIARVETLLGQKAAEA